MGIYNISGDRLDQNQYKICGVVLGASSETNRFLAMKQLYDIAIAKLRNPSYSPPSTAYTYANIGAVCVLPLPSSFYEKYPLNILYSKNASTQSMNASTTKVLSIITGLPFIDTIQDSYTITSSDIQSGSGNYFSAGDILTVEDIMYGMLLPSSNTCAMAFAHYVGAKILGNSSASAGDCVSAFVAEMNRRANAIGCTNSNFTSPSGYSSTNKSTASDLLRITIEASSFPEINRIWNKKTYDIAIKGTNPRTKTISTTVENATLEASYYIFGGKTGHMYNSTEDVYSLIMIAEPKGE